MQFKAAVLNKNPQASKYEDKIVKIQPLDFWFPVGGVMTKTQYWNADILLLVKG